MITVLRFQCIANNFSADALSKIDVKYPYGKTKFWKETLLSSFFVIILGIGFYLGDVVTDLNFSVDMHQMTTKNFTEEIKDCRMKTEELKMNFTKMTCFQSEDLTENFKCLDFLRTLHQQASNCFNREQHFGSEDLKQFDYMRNNFILHWTNFPKSFNNKKSFKISILF